MKLEDLGLDADKLALLNDHINESVGSVAKEKEAVLATNQALKDEKTAEIVAKRALQDQLKKYDGIDIDELQKRISEIDDDKTQKLLMKGKFDEVYSSELEKQRIKYGAQIEEIEKGKKETETLNSELQNTLVSTVRDGGISSAFASEKAEPTLMRPIQILAGGQVLVDGEFKPVVEVSTNGESTFRDSKTGQILQNAEGTFGYSEWVSHLAENEGFQLFASAKGSGAKGSGEGVNKSFGNMGGSREEREAAIAAKFKLG